MHRARLLHPLVLLVLFSLLNIAHAQPPVWTQTNGPAGGHVLAVVRSAQGQYLAGSIGGGIFISSNNGTTWLPSGTGMPESAILSLARHPDGTLVAGTYLGETSCYYSTDAGASWHAASTGSLHPSLARIAVARSGALYGAGSGAGSNPGLYRSTDAGRNWDRIALVDTSTVAVTIDRNGTVIASIEEAPPQGAPALLRSTDNGAHWSVAARPAETIVALAVDSSGTLWAGRRSGVLLRSTNGGAQWDSVADLTGGAPLTIGTISVTPEGYILVGTDRGVFRSTGGGAAWPFAGGWPAGSLINDFAAGPDGIVVGAAFASGVRVSTDHGESWSGANDGLVATFVSSVAAGAEGKALAADLNGVNATSNAGNDWSLAKRINDLTIVGTGPAGKLFAGSILSTGQSTVALLQYSTDDGNNWTVTAPPISTILALGLAPNGAIFVSGRDLDGNPMRGLTRSTDDGTNWTTSSTGFDGSDASSIAFDGQGGIFAAAGGGLYHSTDNGDSWSLLNVGAPAQYVAVDAQEAIFVVTDGDVLYRSTSHGASWDRLGETPHHFSTIVGNRKGELYASTDSYGIFRSINRGASWSAANDSLRNFRVSSLAIDSAGFLYAGTLGSGVFRTLRSTSAGVAAQETMAGLALEAPAPNPTGGAVTIRFTLPAAASAELSVTDRLGRPAASIPEGRVEAGAHAVRFDLSGLASGVYFCTLRVGDRLITHPLVLAR
jgi:photosystem II stability/assembly factor-like uncharacterized protein